MKTERKKLEKAVTNEEYNKIRKYTPLYEYDCGVAKICRLCDPSKKGCLLFRYFQRSWKVHRKSQWK